MASYIWGIDSAQPATEDLYQCVRNQYSYPNYWGRYLTTVPGAAEGLTTTELSFLRSKGIKILPIYSKFTQALGYNQGIQIARNAIFHARKFDFPKGTVLFANIEKFFDIDEAWIRGWVNTLYPSGYRSGIYHDPTEGPFQQAYCEAIENDPKVKNQVILWSAEPEFEPTGLKDAPPFKPKTPECPANVWGWQYGRDAKDCPIDTNLINQKLFQLLVK